jgi:hypothetical protein
MYMRARRPHEVFPHELVMVTAPSLRKTASCGCGGIQFGPPGSVAATGGGMVELHCDGDTGYSCAYFRSSCEDMGGTPICVDLQTPNGTNGQICGCSQWPPSKNYPP